MTTRWTRGFAMWAAPVAALAVALAALPGPLAAQDARDRLLVSADWLLQHRDDPGVVLLHAGRPASYEEGHIPGAALLDLADISVSSEDHSAEAHVMLDLPPDLATVREAFELRGVSDGSTVVVSFDGMSVPDATRVLWTLQALGFQGRAALLDGGVEAWKAAGGELVSTAPGPERGTLTTVPDLDRRATRDWILEHGDRDGVALVDARARASYDGVREERPGRAGHIPGAGSLYVRELFDDAGRLRPAGELRALFATAGVEPGDRVVAYCHIGLFATGVVFAARTLGHETALYDGSMLEWAADGSLPLEAAGGGGGRLR